MINFNKELIYFKEVLLFSILNKDEIMMSIEDLCTHCTLVIVLICSCKILYVISRINVLLLKKVFYHIDYEIQKNTYAMHFLF